MNMNLTTAELICSDPTGWSEPEVKLACSMVLAEYSRYKADTRYYLKEEGHPFSKELGQVGNDCYHCGNPREHLLHRNIGNNKK